MRPEQPTGVARVTAYRGVGPARVERVEPAGQLDEPSDVVDEFVGVSECNETLAGHARAHHFVVPERHAAVFERTGARLADVVEQRAEPDAQAWRGLRDHRDGVREDVLVPVNRVLFE